MGETVTMTLTEFVLARVAEDEAAAREPWIPMLTDVQAWWDAAEDEPGFFADDQPDDVKGLAKTLMQIERRRGHYARVLAECESKRRIIAKAQRASEAFDRHIQPATSAASFALTEVLHMLALPYSDHPDFDESWRL